MKHDIHFDPIFNLQRFAKTLPDPIVIWGPYQGGKHLTPHVIIKFQLHTVLSVIPLSFLS